MNNTKVKLPIFYEFSDLVLKEIGDMHILERGDFTLDFNSSTALPKAFKCIPLEDYDFSTPNIVEKFREIQDHFKIEYNVESNISVLYPPSGFIGWHTNANQNRYNAICTFSETGDGEFRYFEDNTKIVKDIKGWTVKQSEWFNESIPHMAFTNCNRITIAFTSKNKKDIDVFIKNISKNKPTQWLIE